ncbi:MAG: hypothetical protein WKF91_14450 [Segetibacter sp.]
MKDLLPYIATIIGIVFTYMGMRAKNKADAAKTKEDTSDAIIDRLRDETKDLKDIIALEKKEKADLNIANKDVINKLLEKEKTNELLMKQIQELEIKVEQLTTQIAELSLKIH